jgi:hypothetical protein
VPVSKCLLTGRPLISEPCKRSLARSAARRSNWFWSSASDHSSADFTHVCDKHHATVRNEIEERLDITMLFESSSYILRVGLILKRNHGYQFTPLILGCSQPTLALMLRMNSVLHGRSRCIRSSIIESCTLSSLSGRLRLWPKPSESNAE